MDTLESWLNIATRRLSKDSALRVREEIGQHYEAAREGAATEREALTALGNPYVANRHYRRVLLTAEEAKLLREGKREASWLCGKTAGIAALAVVVPVAIGLAGYRSTAIDAALVSALVVFLFAVPRLPIYTVARGRAFRVAKFVALTGTLVFLLGPQTQYWSWLLFSSLTPLAWTEWKRAVIRRKMPVADWPRHLYL